MKEVQLFELKGGMVIAKPVKTKHGQMIADKGTVITSQHIGRFTFYHINSIFITDENDEKEPVQETTPVPKVKEEAPVIVEKPAEEKKEEPVKRERTFQDDHVSYAQKLGRTPEFQDFQVSYSFSLEELKKNFELIKEGQMDPTLSNILTHADGILKPRTPLDLFNMIRSSRAEADSIYSHCINVALISRVLGKWLKFSREDIDELTLAGFLHDIGKIAVNPEILNKKDKLTPEELKEIQNHTVYGHKILKNTSVSHRVKMAALQHHERFDESGYPRNLPGDEIDDFAAIIGIADVYDGMTAIRPYRAPLCIFQVIEEFERDGYQKYNPKFIMTFLSHIAAMYNNSHVILNDGRTVRIVYINRGSLSSPIVETDTGHMLDLSTEPTLKIVKTL